MSGLGRVVKLALRFNWASKARFVLLTLIAAVGMSVFLIVSELSHLSSQDLNQSISQAAGQPGTYAIDFPTSFGLTPQTLADRVTASLKPHVPSPPLMVEEVPAVALDCPPAATLGTQPVVIIRSAAGELVDPPPGEALTQSQVCLGGQVIPSSALYLPTQSEQFEWGLSSVPGANTGVILDGAYERLALLNSTQPITYRFVTVTNQQTDQTTEIQQAIDANLKTTMAAYGVDPAQSSPTVSRLDSAQTIRRAAAGVNLVYSIIAWGVLILGGLGLLVAEMIVVRDRMWFFGLARAVGGRSSHIAGLILADVLLVLSVGTALALAIALALQPLASSFAQSAFQVSGVNFLQLTTVPQLIVGELLVLILAGVYPALKATRQDPLDVLEPRVS